MKAIVYNNSGLPDALKLEDIEKPTAGDDEVLIKVRAASVNAIDVGSLRHPFMRRILSALNKSKINRPGRDVAGQVEAVGSNVTEFKPGDAVFGLCGGAFAEYVCASQSKLVMKPDNVSFEQAAAVPLAGLTALQGLRDTGKVQPGEKVLINGASGGVGTFAVQIAKSLGAHVTAVCSPRNLDQARMIGADRVVDYTREDFTKSGERYDLIYDIVANHSFSARRHALDPNGMCIGAGVVSLGDSMIRLLFHLIKELVLSLFVSQKFVTLMTKLNKEDLTVLRDLVAAGKVTPVIDRSYGLSEVPEAVRYFEEGHARGKVVITIESADCADYTDSKATTAVVHL
jgi:NADPH:quinone reductase-like Zn-dependent oxidoreductase